MSTQTIARPEPQTREFWQIFQELSNVQCAMKLCADGAYDLLIARHYELEQEARAAIHTALGVDFDTLLKVMG